MIGGIFILIFKKGWCDVKKLFISQAIRETDGGVVNCNHDAIGNMAIAFCKTSGVQMGWLASQADILADDWVFVE